MESNDKDIIIAHFDNARKLWEDEGVKTPGNSLEDFMVNSYGPKVSTFKSKGGPMVPNKANMGNMGNTDTAMSGPEEPSTDKNTVGPLQRYVSYFNIGE